MTQISEGSTITVTLEHADLQALHVLNGLESTRRYSPAYTREAGIRIEQHLRASTGVNNIVVTLKSESREWCPGIWSGLPQPTGTPRRPGRSTAETVMNIEESITKQGGVFIVTRWKEAFLRAVSSGPLTPYYPLWNTRNTDNGFSPSELTEWHRRLTATKQSDAEGLALEIDPSTVEYFHQDLADCHENAGGTTKLFNDTEAFAWSVRNSRVAYTPSEIIWVMLRNPPAPARQWVSAVLTEHDFRAVVTKLAMTGPRGLSVLERLTDIPDFRFERRVAQGKVFEKVTIRAIIDVLLETSIAVNHGLIQQALRDEDKTTRLLGIRLMATHRTGSGLSLTGRSGVSQ